MSITFYVGNLAFPIAAEDLKKLISGQNEGESARADEDRGTLRSRGFCFVRLSSSSTEQERRILKRFIGEEVGARALTVREYRPHEERRRSRVIEIEPSAESIALVEITEEDEVSEKQAEEVFALIDSSRERAQNTQAEIDRLKKKTQAILNNLQ